MLSFETEEKLCRLLKKLAIGERNVQIQRVILCQEYHFVLQNAFSLLDSMRLNALIPKSFNDFLPAHLNISQEQLYLMIKQYSSLGNGRLSINDFSQFVLPHTNQTVRSITLNRNLNSFAQRTNFSSDFALTRLIQKEVELQQDIELIKQELYLSEDFSFWNAFKAIDTENRGCFREFEMQKFARKFGQFLSIEEIDAIFRRIDIKDDMAIDYDEFVEFVMPVYSNKKKGNVGDKDIQEGEVKQNQQQDNKQVQESKEQKQEKKLLISIENQEEKKDIESPRFAQLTSFQIPQKPAKEEKKQKEFQNKLYLTTNFQLLFELLRTQVNFQRSLQFTRRNLAVLNNFSIEQTFDLFDKEKLGKIYISHFQQALEDLQVEYTREDMWLIFMRWGKSQEDTFVFQKQEFQKLILPKNPQYSQKLQSKPKQLLSQETKEILSDFFRVLINYQRNSQALCKEISKDSGFDIQEAFNKFDIDKDGIISHQDLKAAIFQAGLNLTDSDVELVYKRYTQNQIKIQEFSNEILRKLK